MKLLALRCPSCTQPLAPGAEDVVMMCGNCGTAVSMDEAGLQPVAVNFAAPKQEQVGAWLPFWVYNGRVSLQKRESQGGYQTKQAEQFWQEPHRFLVPAWELSVRDAREMGSNLLKNPPVLQAVPRPQTAVFTPATVTAEDARKLMEFIVLTIEAERSDWLKELQFTLQTDPAELWAIPADEKGNGRWQLQVG